MLSWDAIVRSTSSEMSWGLEVENLILRPGTVSATLARRAAKSTSPSRYESTFCPSSVISLYPADAHSHASRTIVLQSRLRSAPRVYGTTQYEHTLLHPRIMEMNADTPLRSSLTGEMSA